MGQPAEILPDTGLVYSTDARPGWSRRRCGRGFTYLNTRGELIRDERLRRRIKQLAIPPAWQDVWICSRPDGHIQATGRDEQGRKQYIYHPAWSETRSQAKYAGLTGFASGLPGLRRRVTRDLAAASDTPDHRTVTAAIVSLLDRTLMRVGNWRYARSNGSYGLTTLQDEHVEVHGEELHFSFRGKSGKDHDITLRNRKLARIVRLCQELPGQDLFQYEDEDGELRVIDSADVNGYVRESVGEQYGTKDFRTWAATVITAGRLADLGEPSSATAAKRNVTAAIRTASERLGNTLAVCRQGYVHPLITESYLAGEFPARYEAALEAVRDNRPAGLRLGEAATLRLLQEQS